MITKRVIKSPIGDITLLEEGGAIVGLYFKDNADRVATNAQQTNVKNTVLDICEEELAEYFAGKRKTFTVPISAKGTPFREKVWDALNTIEYGKTVSYLDIARQIGNAKAVRAVGGANHNNPISIIIPCHRVIGANRSLTGYGGGLDAKKWLLELEGVVL